MGITKPIAKPEEKFNDNQLDRMERYLAQACYMGFHGRMNQDPKDYAMEIAKLMVAEIKRNQGQNK